MEHLDRRRWRKSSYSANGGTDCVEVGLEHRGRECAGAGYQSPFGPCLVVQPGSLAYLRQPAEGGRPGQCRFPVNLSNSQGSFPLDFQLDVSRCDCQR